MKDNALLRYGQETHGLERNLALFRLMQTQSLSFQIRPSNTYGTLITLCAWSCAVFLWRKSKELILVTKQTVQHDVMITMGCGQENIGTHRKARCSPSRRGESEVGLENEFHQSGKSMEKGVSGTK